MTFLQVGSLLNHSGHDLQRASFSLLREMFQGGTLGMCVQQGNSDAIFLRRGLWVLCGYLVCSFCFSFSRGFEIESRLTLRISLPRLSSAESPGDVLQHQSIPHQLAGPALCPLPVAARQHLWFLGAVQGDLITPMQLYG